MSRLTDQIWKHGHRAALLANVPALLRRMKFKTLRRSYYQAFWAHAARDIGAIMTPITDGFCRIRHGDLETLVRDGEVMLDSHLTLEVMGNKPLVYQLMSERGLPTPDHCVYDMCKLDQAISFLEGQSGPVVVKPAYGTGGGHGVTTGIRTTSELKTASRLAARLCPDLIIEAQIDGHSYRLLYLDGVFIDAVRRDPPVIHGDGKKTIRQLVARENQKRLTGGTVTCLLYTSPSPRDRQKSRMPSSA